ncbi:CCCH finger DNA binding protein [Pseudohyphozyma bogoriensis]|nr:CCCH finger DNA binding protein [Pseudohyphozyma bogoriensis]
MSVSSLSDFHSGAHDCCSLSNERSTPPSSVASFDSDDEILELHNQQGKLVQKLLKDKRESDRLIAAWQVRCDTLEAEVARLAGLLGEMEAKLRIGKAPERATVNSEPPKVEVKPKPAGTRAALCLDWRASCDKNQVRLQVDPSKSMSKQDPPPCNAYYIQGLCSVPKCKFSHQYDLKPEHIDEMKRGARFRLCNTYARRLALELLAPSTTLSTPAHLPSAL